MFAVATFVIRSMLPYLTKRAREAEIRTYAIFVAALAFLLFPFFRNAFAPAAIAFLLGLGCGCGQPLSMSLIHALSPRERVSESTGSNSVMLVAGGLLMRRNVVPGSGPQREGIDALAGAASPNPPPGSLHQSFPAGDAGVSRIPGAGNGPGAVTSMGRRTGSRRTVRACALAFPRGPR